MIWFLVTFVLLLVLTRWITKHIQAVGYLLTGDGQAALTLYLLLTFPGVLLHEVSHAITAWLLRVKVRRLSIGIRKGRRTRSVRRQATLGSVDVARTDPVRASLIGLAPLLVGCAAILLIGQYALGMAQWGTFSLGQFWGELRGSLGSAGFWLWAYLVFAIGNAMLPSAADRQSWWVALFCLFFVGLVLYFAGLLDAVSEPLSAWAQEAVNNLTYAFAVTVVVDAAFAVVVFLIEGVLWFFGLGRVQYRSRRS